MSDPNPYSGERVVPGTVTRTLRFVDFTAEYSMIDPGSRRVVTTIEEANTVTSESVYDKDTHYPVIDIDHPCTLIPSTTPGHFHLYIDKSVPAPKYLAMLEAMSEAGVVEQGYYQASKARGHSAVRLPWVQKPEAPVGEQSEGER